MAESRQPTPGVRFVASRTLLARRGCALRYALCFMRELLKATGLCALALLLGFGREAPRRVCQSGASQGQMPATAVVAEHRLVRPALRGALLGMEIGTRQSTLPVGAGR